MFRKCTSGAMLFATTLCATALASSGTFAPFLSRTAPTIVRDLGEETRGGVSLRRVVFYSRTAETPQGPIRSEIFAAIARPIKPGQYPGILVLHGGGGSAHVDKAVEWAGRGYIAIAPDLPGIANPDNTPESKGAWKLSAYAHTHFVATPDATASSIFDGVLAGVQSLYLLRAQPGVIQDRVGVTGVSWGGYATIMVAGLTGKDVHAAFSIYGSGHFDLGSAFQTDLNKLAPEEEAAWLNQLDARNYAPGIAGTFFEAAAANDTFFWPSAVTATLADIPAPKNQMFAPNADHWFDVPGGCEHNKEKPWHDNGWMAMQATYFDYLLKGEGQPFPEVNNAQTRKSEDGSQRVRFKVKTSTKIDAAAVYYSPTNEPWKTRKWIKVDASRHGDWFEASAPAGMDCVALVTDNRPVTVTSGILRWQP